VICTILYIAVSAVLTGMVRYSDIDISAPVSNAFGRVGLPWAQFLISLGAIAGITSVLLVMMLSQPRILLAMARDGLLPKGTFAAVHPTYRTPWKGQILTGVFVGVLASFIGTLLAFVMVCAAVLAMRKISPDAERPFKAPWFPFLPIMGILTCALLMFSLPPENWLRLFVWLAIGFVIYFAYGIKHSVLRKAAIAERPTRK
jgi:APA family basic amino acid/polyamine antiporter